MVSSPDDSKNPIAVGCAGMKAKSYLLVSDLIAACVAFGREKEPGWQTRIERARCELIEYIEALEKDDEEVQE